MTNRVPEHFLRPVDASGNGLGVGIEEHLVGIKTVAVRRIIRPVDAIAVQLTRPQSRHKAVPDEIRPLRETDARRLRRAQAIEEAEFDARRVLGEQREVHPVTRPRRTQRIRMPLPQAWLGRGRGRPVRHTG
jgi:hypothetical protein